MCYDKHYQNSICFSSTDAETLNKLAFQLDHRLFLFAYYEPRAYASSESYFSRFRTAVINVYGLLWDCGPHLSKLLRGRDSILLSDWKRIQKDFELLRSMISSFRSILCHNCSRELTLNEEHYTKVENWLYTEIGIDLPYDNLQDIHWQAMLHVIVCKCDALVADLEKSMQRLIETDDSNRRNCAIQQWIEEIAEMYCSHPEYLLHTMATLYQWYVENGGSQASIRTDYPLRSQTIRWLEIYCNAPYGKWYTKWLDKGQVFQLIKNWPRKWAQWSGCLETECHEPPLPGSEFFRILAGDIDRFATNPHAGYQG